MNIEKIYRNFSGFMKNCKGAKCEKSCCSSASQKGVDLYPDEVIYFAKKYGKRFPAKIKRIKASETGFAMFGCLQNECLLKDERPIICRGFPVKPFSIKKGIHKIHISEDCPLHNELSTSFIQNSYALWQAVYSDPFRTNFFKKWLASLYLFRLP